MPAPLCSHKLQFYHTDASLLDSVSSFILPTFFSTTHAAVIVATPQHLETLESHLRAQNLSPDVLVKRCQLLLAPADSILETITPEGTVSEHAFNSYFAPLFEKIQRKYPKMLVYGELVNILCERGQHEEAATLEGIWNRFLASRPGASLLCGYNMAAFALDGLEDVFQRLCKAHSAVSPATTDRQGKPLKQRREDHSVVVAMLQQSSLRLQRETGRRVAAEVALGSVMEHFGNRTTEGIEISEEGGRRVEMGPVGIVAATSLTDTVEYFRNQRFLEYSGLEDRMVGGDTGWVSAVHYEDREMVSHYLRLSDGKARRCEYRFVQPTGVVRWMSGETVSRSTGYVHTCVDITEFRTPSTTPTEPSANGTKRDLTPSPPHEQSLHTALYSITQLLYTIIHTPLPRDTSTAHLNALTDGTIPASTHQQQPYCDIIQTAGLVAKTILYRRLSPSVDTCFDYAKDGLRLITQSSFPFTPLQYNAAYTFLLFALIQMFDYSHPEAESDLELVEDVIRMVGRDDVSWIDKANKYLNMVRELKREGLKPRMTQVRWQMVDELADLGAIWQGGWRSWLGDMDSLQEQEPKRHRG